MMKRTIFSLLAIFLFLSACNLPETSSPTSDTSFLAFTQSAQTVEVRLTELAATSTPTPQQNLPPPINTPFDTPEATPAPTVTQPTQMTPSVAICDSAQFVADVTVPDGTEYDPKSAFTKTWRLMNSGTCTWTTAYAVVFDKGELMSAVTPVNLTASVPPGGSVDISINMIAPATDGKYVGYWKLRNASGAIFGIGNEAKPYYVSIKVGKSTKTSVYNMVDNYCSAQWTSGAVGTLPCPGGDGDVTGFVIKQTNPQLETGSTEDEASLLVSPQKVDNGYISGKYPVFKVESGDRFRSIIGCAYNANNCNVIFQLNYIVDGSAEQTLTSWNETYNGAFQDINIDLSSLAGKNVIFILRINANGSSDQDRAQWLQPRIVR
jgi:hypothetical protein